MAEKGKKGKISPGLKALNERRAAEHKAKTELSILVTEEQIAQQKQKTDEAKAKEMLATQLAAKNYNAVDELINIALTTEDESLKVRIAMKFLDKDIGNMKTVDLQKGAKANITINLTSFRGMKQADCSPIETDRPLVSGEYDEFISEHGEHDWGDGSEGEEGEAFVEGKTTKASGEVKAQGPHEEGGAPQSGEEFAEKADYAMEPQAPEDGKGRELKVYIPESSRGLVRR